MKERTKYRINRAKKTTGTDPTKVRNRKELKLGTKRTEVKNQQNENKEPRELKVCPNQTERKERTKGTLIRNQQNGTKTKTKEPKFETKRAEIKNQRNQEYEPKEPK